MNHLTQTSLLCAAAIAICLPAKAETALEISLSPGAVFQLAGMQFLPEADDNGPGFAGRELKGNYNTGEHFKQGCTEGSRTPCSATEITIRTYRAPNGANCFVCSNGDYKDCLKLGFKLQNDWPKSSTGNWQFQLSQSCPYDRSYVKGSWVQTACTLPDCVAITQKPENSSFVATSCTDCSGTKTINSSWKCDDGFMEANGSCLKKSCSVSTCSGDYIYTSSSSCPKGRGLGYESCTPVNADCSTGQTKYKCTCTPYMENGRWVDCAIR